MPTINTAGWALAPKPQSKFMHIGKTRLPVFVRQYLAPHDSYALVFPQGFLERGVWGSWIAHCQRHASFDPKAKCWVWTTLQVGRCTTENTIIHEKLTKEELREARQKAEEAFDRELAELSKSENVPENLWPSYQYPPHYTPAGVAPTALQRILVSRYWNQPAILAGASVGTGKSRICIDILNSRALAPTSKNLNDSARIVLLIAPLSLHENWKREFAKWAHPGVDFRVHKFKPGNEFWGSVEEDAEDLFDGPQMLPGGLVIITTHQSLSRATLVREFAAKGYTPTCIVIDEVQRFFRKPTNAAYYKVQALRAKAHCIIGLSGTPTSKFEDYHALEELLMPGEHWGGAAWSDYQRLGDPLTMTSSGLWRPEFHTFDRAVKEYHKFRIGKQRIFLASKRFYMADALPGLEQSELGEFADMRLSFSELFDSYPHWVDEAYALQKKQNEKTLNERALANTLLLRLQQLASVSEASQKLLLEFVKDFLEPDEPCIFWTLFKNDPTPELPTVVKTLLDTGSTVGWIEGGMDERQRWAMLDAFDKGQLRFMVLQAEAAGVGLNLVRSNKAYFNSIPLSYLTVTQAEGRTHRMGQTAESVTSFFACTSPVAAFARRLYDTRKHLNQTIPENLGNLLQRYAPQILSTN